MKRVFIDFHGCAILIHDTRRYSKYFRVNGWKEVSNPQDADLVLITTCGVTNFEEDCSIRLIDKARSKMKKGATLVIGGCLPKINPNRLKEKYNALMFGPREEEKLDKIVNPKVLIKDIFWEATASDARSSSKEDKELNLAENLSKKFNDNKFLEIYDYLTGGRYLWKENDLFEVKVAVGCNYNCSYCATKLAKGNLTSIPIKTVLEQFKIGVNQGYRKILLIGDEVGEYGMDIGTNLVELLNTIIPFSKDARIALRYVSPFSLITQYSQLKKYFANGKIYYFCCSVQSGSPRVLRDMNRPNNLDKLQKILSEIDSLNPFVFKHSQMIVGFPGETEEDFMQSIAFMKNSKLDYTGIIKYSERPNTRAANLPYSVPDNIIERRYQRAREIRNAIRRRKLENKTYLYLENIERRK